MARRRTRRSLGLRLPDLYAEDEALMATMTARHPTRGRSHLQMQLFGAKARTYSMATSVASGHDARGGREPPGDVIGVAGVSLHPEAVGTADACKVTVILGHVGGGSRRVVVGAHLTIAEAWSHPDEAVVGLRDGDASPPSRSPRPPTPASSPPAC